MNVRGELNAAAHTFFSLSPNRPSCELETPRKEPDIAERAAVSDATPGAPANPDVRPTRAQTTWPPTRCPISSTHAKNCTHPPRAAHN